MGTEQHRVGNFLIYELEDSVTLVNDDDGEQIYLRKKDIPGAAFALAWAAEHLRGIEERPA